MLSTYFFNLRLRVKLLMAFGSLIILSVFLILTFVYTLQKVDEYERTARNADGLNIDIQKMDREVNYFLYEGYKKEEFLKTQSSSSLNNYRNYRDTVLVFLDEIEAFDAKRQRFHLVEIRPMVDSLDKNISSLIKLLTIRGFKDYGLEGQLRKEIHAVEKSTYPYEKADMLTLRRHEKDFFLRKELKYQTEFNNTIVAFMGKLGAKPDGSDKLDVMNSLQRYQSLFNQIVDVEQKIGLKENDGLKGLINKYLATVRENISRSSLYIKEESEQFNRRATTGLIVIFCVQLILGTLLAIIYANIITRAIKELQRGMQRLSDGYFPEPLQVRSAEEIGKTKRAFNLMIDRLKEATAFAQALGTGNYKVDYNAEFGNDVLAQSMVKLRDQLADANHRQFIDHWTNTGIAKLNDILKSNEQDVYIIGDQLLKTIIHYVNANQGAIYLSAGQPDDHHLERIATYAYDKKKFVTERLEIGEGLVGQCFLEEEPIVMTSVPRDFAKITSGLGGATPRFFILIALRVQDEVMGVMEIASFDILKGYQIEFLERLSELIGSLLNNRRNAFETRQLLDEAREQAKRLAEQDETIRQQEEEMRTIQEQLIRERDDLVKEVAHLRELLQKEVALEDQLIHVQHATNLG